MATHSNTLAWRIPLREEPGGLQSRGSQRVGYDWVTDQQHDKKEAMLTGVCPHSCVAQEALPRLPIKCQTKKEIWKQQKWTKGHKS